MINSIKIENNICSAQKKCHNLSFIEIITITLNSHNLHIEPY